MPYQSEWKDVYEGFELEIHLVNHCNINCRNCNHFSPIAEEWYITLEDFNNQLLLVKEKLPSLQRLLLLGGEPFLHPQLIELIHIANKIFPNVELRVLTNGTIPLTEEQIKQIKKNNDKVVFIITPYPNKKNILEQQLNKHEISYQYQFERLFYKQTLIDIKGSQPRCNFFFCDKYKLPCFILKDYKIFICPFSAYIHNFTKFTNNLNVITSNDYLDLYNCSLKDLQDFCFISKPVCKYCKEGDYQLWGFSDKDSSEYEKNNLELLLTDYSTYYKFINNKEIYDKINKNKIDQSYASNLLKEKILHFEKSKIDIIIPFYQVTTNQIEQLKQNLLQQTIINDCIVCLISDNSPNEKEVFTSFYNSPLHIVFLKNNKRLGPGPSRNLGIKNTYGEFLFFLDFDDLFLNTNILENMYNENKNKYKMAIYKKDSLDILFLERKHLKMLNLKYTNLYCHEDELFLNIIELLTSSKDILRMDQEIVQYDRKNPLSIGNSCSHSLVESFKFLSNYYYVTFIENNNLTFNNKYYEKKENIQNNKEPLVLLIQKELIKSKPQFSSIIKPKTFIEEILLNELISLEGGKLNEQILDKMFFRR